MFKHATGPTESKYWHFRTNDLSIEQYDKLKSVECSWIVIGEVEKENEKGTHYHAAVCFDRSRRLPYAVKALLYDIEAKKDNDYYLETKYMKCSVEQFIAYCTKNGTKYNSQVSESKETIPQFLQPEPETETKMSKTELNKLRIQKVRENDTDWFLENDFTFMLGSQYSKLIVFAQQDKTPKDTLQDLDNYWIYGKSGTGKSSTVNYLYPDRYVKICSNEKWDGYSNHLVGHEVVHIEELDNFEDIEKGLEGLAGLKAKADRYPFPVRFNYGNRNLMIRPKSIIITSNFRPNEILSGGDKYGHATKGLEIQIQAIYRKFKVMHINEYMKLKNVTHVMNDGKIVGVKKLTPIEVKAKSSMRAWLIPEVSHT